MPLLDVLSILSVTIYEKGRMHYPTLSVAKQCISFAMPPFLCFKNSEGLLRMCIDVTACMCGQVLKGGTVPRVTKLLCLVVSQVTKSLG